MENGMRRYGDWALITGASMGLGEAFARRMAAAGVHCVLVALESELLDNLARELTERHGVQCRPLALDLTREDMLDHIRAATSDIGIDVLINNAGFGVGGDFATRDPARLAKLVKLNCLAPVMLTRHFLPGMLERRRGAIVIVGSVMSFITAPSEAAYNASKAFDLHFGESLWGELRNSGVDVITVCPGGMKTTFFAGEGIRASDVQRLHRFSHHPERVVDLTLRRLGKRPIAVPPFAVFSSLLVRLLPRRWVTTIVGTIMRRFVRYEEPGG